MTTTTPNFAGGALPEGEWRLMDTPPAPGAWNMALDEALAASVRAGAPPVLRVYRWLPACLSLGRNQPARGRYDLHAIARRGWEVVRRPTGGRAVLHDRELTYSVAVPEGVLGSPRETYAAVNRALVAGLRLLGVPAQLQPRTGRRAPAPSLSPCFQEPVEGEVVAAGRKLVGSAQRRDRGVILQHGSLLLENDQRDVRSLLVREASAGIDGTPVDGMPTSEGWRARVTDGAGETGSIPQTYVDDATEQVVDDEAPATLAGLLGRVPAWGELVGALAAGWQAATGTRLVPAEPTEDEVEAAREAAERYRSAAWTWHL